MTRKTVVLCIDDHVRGLAVRKILLEAQGFRVLTAEDGRTGLAIVKQEPIDVVILDYRMPGMNGGVVAEILRRDHPHLPILFLSGYTAEIPAPALKMADGLIEKGEPTIVLVRELERVTGRSAMAVDSAQQTIPANREHVARSRDLLRSAQTFLPPASRERRC